MKTTLRIILYSIGGVIALSFVASIPSSTQGLQQDFEDIRILIPAGKLNQVFQDYIKQDKEVMAIFRYLTSGDLGNAWFAIAKEPEVQELFAWVNAHSSSAYSSEDSDNIRDGDLLSSSSKGSIIHFKRTGGWKGFIQDYYSIYPRDKVMELIRKKISEKGLFAEFWTKIHAMKSVYERILTLPEVLKVIKNLSALEVDVKELDVIIRTEMKWN